MSLLDTVNAMKENITKAAAVMAQIQPLHAEFTKESEDIAGIDRTQAYFGVNADGTATILSFDPNGAPQFLTCQPLPAEAVPVPAPVEAAANVVPLVPASMEVTEVKPEEPAAEIKPEDTPAQ